MLTGQYLQTGLASVSQPTRQTPTPKPRPFLINGAALPRVSQNLQVTQHRPNGDREGKLWWNPGRFCLYPFRDEDLPTTEQFLEDVIFYSSLNAGVMQQIADGHEDLLPTAWNPYLLIFGGTEFRCYDGHTYFGVLYRRGRHWIESYEPVSQIDLCRHRLVCVIQ